MIDGTIARKTNNANEFGSRLDTIADFAFVVACMIKLLLWLLYRKDTFPICKRFQNKKHIYKWLYVIPYGEAILAIFSCYFLFNNNFEKIHITIQNCYAIKHFN